MEQGTQGAPGVVRRYESRIGEIIGDLTFVRISDVRGDRNRVLAVFLCACGEHVRLPAGRTLQGGYREHCGCKTDHRAARKHGMRYSREYSSWQAMKARCLDPNNKDYPRWGGQGVTIHDAWVSSFEAFFEHVGPRPQGTSIDRIDGTRGYEPGNVRWATPSEQQRNRRSAFRWHVKGLLFESLGEAASHFGVSEHTVWRWVNGQFDRRRNTFVAPQENCHVIPRY